MLLGSAEEALIVGPGECVAQRLIMIGSVICKLWRV